MILSSRTVRKLRRNTLSLNKANKVTSLRPKVESILKTINKNGKIISKKERTAKVLKGKQSTSMDKASLFADKKESRFHKDAQSNSNKDRSFSEL
jgi:hypothetical protein